MAFKKSIIGALTSALALCLAVSSAHAVSLKSHMTQAKSPVAFAEVSLATASAAELHSAMQLAIQQAITEELGALVEDEVKKSDIFENVKGVASSALGDMFGSLKQSMGQTCQRFAALAQKKLDSIDSKLKDVAEGDGGDESKDQLSQFRTAVTADRVAFLQVAIRHKHKGFFDRIKKFAKKGFEKVKSVGRAVKKGLKSVWGAIKPAVANGVRSAVNRMKAQVPGIIGQACEKAEDKLERLESKIVPDSVDDGPVEGETLL